jgi:hypothetical protein
MSKLTGYELSRDWFDFCFENPELIKPNHTALYFFAIEHYNRLGGKDKFGFPSTMVMEAIGIKSYNTYIKTLNDLADWGAIKMIERSKNQYSANIIALSKFNKALNKALDKALIKHSTKQSESTVQSISSIDKQRIIEQLTIEQVIGDSYPFDEFWNQYDKKADRKKCELKFNKLDQGDREKIKNTIIDYVKSTPDPKYRKNPLTYLNGECWNNEITTKGSDYSHLPKHIRPDRTPMDNLTF